jgi:hypothetical protein
MHDTRRKERAELWFAASRHHRNDNGDKARYSDRRGNFSKGLQHNHEGLVTDVTAFDLFVHSLNVGNVAGIDSTLIEITPTRVTPAHFQQGDACAQATVMHLAAE